MATAQASPEISKPSFAKVAASSKSPMEPMHRAVTNLNGKAKEPNVIMPPGGPVIANGSSELITGLRYPVTSRHGSPPGPAITTISESLDRLSISNLPNLVVSPSGMPGPPGLGIRESGSDESQKADSSSELGTKPPSLDGKSITSGTTFALDEKESLRPDDSASVKAAEDDDAFSVRGSLVAGSRLGSEIAARARGIQLGDMPTERRPIPPTSAAVQQGVLTPQSASSEQQPSPNPAMPLAGPPGSTDVLNVIYRQTPDEKLLEALANPRDRLFLLRLEKEVIEFVQDSKEPYTDLPPSNSFYRMLTHKLADYYHMTHSYEPQVGSVRIFRTPFCRVPLALSSMSPQSPGINEDSPPPPALLPRKIMRRGVTDTSGGPLSSAASKATSETGSDSREKTAQSNNQLTREEREEQYKLARERIFGASEDVTPEGDGIEMSRASSVSTNNKSSIGKRKQNAKQRREHSDSFDSRHHYAPYWSSQQQPWVPQQIPQQPYGVPYPMNVPYAGQPQPAYPAQNAPVYTAQNPPYPPPPNMAPGSQYPTYPVAQYPAQQEQQRYQTGGSPMPAYGAPVPPPALRSWQPGPNAPSYPVQPPNAPTALVDHLGVPYAFGQLPANANPHDPKSQHPIPGSYNRQHGFNPQTQSFVPGGSPMAPVQPSQPFYPAPGSHHGSPQIGPPHVAYPGYQQPTPPYGGGFSMARQGSNNSAHAYPSPHVVPHGQAGPPMPNAAHAPLQHIPPNANGGRPNGPQGTSPSYTHLPNYGNPASLPQKPATGV